MATGTATLTSQGETVVSAGRRRRRLTLAGVRVMVIAMSVAKLFEIDGSRFDTGAAVFVDGDRLAA